MAHTQILSPNDSVPRHLPTENAHTRSLYNKSSCVSILSVLFYVCLILRKKSMFRVFFFFKEKKNGGTKSPTKAIRTSKWEAVEHQRLWERIPLPCLHPEHPSPAGPSLPPCQSLPGNCPKLGIIIKDVGSEEEEGESAERPSALTPQCPTTLRYGG